MPKCAICSVKLNYFAGDYFGLPNGFDVCADCRHKYDELQKIADEGTGEELDLQLTGYIENADNKENANAVAEYVRKIYERNVRKKEDIIKRREEAVKRAEDDKKRQEELRIQQENEARRREAEAERRRLEEAEAQNCMEENLRSRGLNGYYEYRTLTLVDENGGFISADTVTENLNILGKAGWRLVCAYSNEVGHNSTSAGAFGFSTGTNSTIDQNVLILERFVRI